MADVDEFLAAVVPPLTAADTAIHNGDAGQRIALWSRKDPVTLFGALQTKTGWGEIAPIFEMLASRFSNCESFEYEVFAAGVSGDLAYIVGRDEDWGVAVVECEGRAPPLRRCACWARDGRFYCPAISRSVLRWLSNAVRPWGVSLSHVRGHLPTWPLRMAM